MDASVSTMDVGTTTVAPHPTATHTHYGVLPHLQPSPASFLVHTSSTSTSKSSNSRLKSSKPWYRRLLMMPPSASASPSSRAQTPASLKSDQHHLAIMPWSETGYVAALDEDEEDGADIMDFLGALEGMTPPSAKRQPLSASTASSTSTAHKSPPSSPISRTRKRDSLPRPPFCPPSSPLPPTPNSLPTLPLTQPRTPNPPRSAPPTRAPFPSQTPVTINVHAALDPSPANTTSSARLTLRRLDPPTLSVVLDPDALIPFGRTLPPEMPYSPLASLSDFTVKPAPPKLPRKRAPYSPAKPPRVTDLKAFLPILAKSASQGSMNDAYKSKITPLEVERQTKNMRAPPPSPIVIGAKQTATNGLSPMSMPPLTADRSSSNSPASPVPKTPQFHKFAPTPNIRGKLNMEWDRQGNPWDEDEFEEDVFGGYVDESTRGSVRVRRRAGSLISGRKMSRTRSGGGGGASIIASEGGRAARRVLKKDPPPPPLPDPGLLNFMGEEIPTMRHLFEASLVPVWDQHGTKIPFGRLFEDQVTIVVFIRHFWCPLCQDYMESIVRSLDPEVMKQAQVKLIVIGCGDPAMIKSYNEKIFHSPFELYTDPRLELHTALGMTLKTLEPGPEEEKGDYVQHGTLVGTLNVIGRALTNYPPNVLIKKGGDIKQLGGEFIMGPGLRCSFAHRMANTRAHANIRRVAELAGVVFPSPPPPRPMSSVGGTETIMEDPEEGDVVPPFDALSPPPKSFGLPRMSMTSDFTVPRNSQGSTNWHTASACEAVVCDDVVCADDFCGMDVDEPRTPMDAVS